MSKLSSNSIGCECVLVCNIPVVKQYVRCPHLLRSETEVLNTWILRLVPLEVVVVPLLRDTSKALALLIGKNTKLCIVKNQCIFFQSTLNTQLFFSVYLFTDFFLFFQVSF